MELELYRTNSDGEFKLYYLDEDGNEHQVSIKGGHIMVEIDGEFLSDLLGLNDPKLVKFRVVTNGDNNSSFLSVEYDKEDRE